MTQYLLPENFNVYVKGESVINYPAPGYEARILPTVNKYMGEDGGYIACYSHNQEGSIYSVGGGIYVMGQIRLQGKYIGRIFEPKGYEGKDISAAQELKDLCNETFPSAKGGGWAGGDTGGWFGISSFPRPSKKEQFQGTSKEGNFQSALEEAINKALEALSGEISDQRIEWKIMETSGSYGGFTGENAITVTIEAQAEETPNVPTETEFGCFDWGASYITMPGSKPKLNVSGICRFPTAGYSVKLERVQQENNPPGTLMLTAITNKPQGPVLQVITSLEVDYTEETDEIYTTVQIGNIKIPVV